MYKELLSLQNYIGIAAPSTAVRRRLQTSMQTGRSRQYFHVVHCRMAYCTVAVLFMVALWNRADHYIFILWFLSLLSSFFPRLISAWQIGCLPYVYTWCEPIANLECRYETCCTLEVQDAKNHYFGTIAQLCRAISSELRHVSTIGKKFLNNSTSSTCPDNMVNFGLLTAEICWRVWGTPAHFNGFRVLAALLHGTLVVGVSQTLRR